MKKGRIIENAGIIAVLLGWVAYISGYKLIGSIVFVSWYLTFGLVGSAVFAWKQQRIRLSRFLVAITIPFFLQPYRRAWYRWLKMWFAIKKGNGSPLELLKRAEKVDARYLGSDMNKARFYLMKAAICLDVGERNDAETYMELAKAHDHEGELTVPLEEMKGEKTE